MQESADFGKSLGGLEYSFRMLADTSVLPFLFQIRYSRFDSATLEGLVSEKRQQVQVLLRLKPLELSA